MSTRWEREDYWPEVDYSEPPAGPPRIDWFILVAWLVTIGSSLLVWMLILWIVWEQV